MNGFSFAETSEIVMTGNGWVNFERKTHRKNPKAICVTPLGLFGLEFRFYLWVTQPHRRMSRPISIAMTNIHSPNLLLTKNILRNWYLVKEKKWNLFLRHCCCLHVCVSVSVRYWHCINFSWMLHSIQENRIYRMLHAYCTHCLLSWRVFK